MLLSNGTGFLLLVSLCLSCLAKPGAEVNKPDNSSHALQASSSSLTTPTEASKTATASSKAENSVRKHSGPSENEKEGKVINFALNEINNATTLQYKERVDDVLQVRHNRKRSDLYHLKLRLTRSHCRKDNSSCDVSYDPRFAKKTEYDPIIAPLEPLRPGRVVVVEGGIPLKSNGFDITIQTGIKRSVAAQLRISARFSEEGDVVLLKHFDGCWNLDKHYEGILRTTTNFTISITCLSTHFEIAINDNILDKFHHVLPYVDATHLSIHGEVDINTVTGVGPQLPNKIYPQLPDWKRDDVKYQIAPYVPFTAPLDMPLRPGKIIQIKGRTHSLVKWFSVYIQSGSNDSTQDAVQLRLKSYFGDPKNKVNLDYYDGSWSGLERYDQPMTAGHSFKIVITCLSKQFKISINDKDFASYDHKLPYENASHLRIEGRVNITEVIGIDQLPPTHSFNPPELADRLSALPLYDLPLTPGRKLKLWGSIPKNSTSFDLGLRNSARTVYPLIVNFDLSKGKWTLSLRNLQKSTSGTVQKNEVDWIQAGDSIEMEIEYNSTVFNVRFFNNWEYSYTSTQVPISNATHLYFQGNLLVHKLTGQRNGPDPAPPASSQPARICELNAWYQPHVRDMWINGLECVNDSPRTGIVTGTSSEEL